jgi:hypothetical protein
MATAGSACGVARHARGPAPASPPRLNGAAVWRIPASAADCSAPRLAGSAEFPDASVALGEVGRNPFSGKAKHNNLTLALS